MAKSARPTETETVNRIIRYRLYPGDAEMGNRLQGTAGAARFIWNLFLDLYDLRWETWKAMGPKPSVAFFTLGWLFTQVQKGQPEAWLASALNQVRPDIDDYTWLQAYASKSVKQVLKDLELAYQAYFNPARPEAGVPLRKGEYGTTPVLQHPLPVPIRISEFAAVVLQGRACAALRRLRRAIVRRNKIHWVVNSALDQPTGHHAR